MLCAHSAGIRVFVTGGIGGVHRGAESSFDVSADLEELARIMTQHDLELAQREAHAKSFVPS